MRRCFCRNRIYLLTVILTFALTVARGQADANPVIPLEILEPPERAYPVHDFPVSVGMIFPERALRTPSSGALVDDRGRSVPFDYEVTGWWSAQKQSIKWLLIHFKASTDRSYSFVVNGHRTKPEGVPLAMETTGGIEVNTGPLEVHLPRKGGPVFGRVLLDGELVVEAGGSDFWMLDDEGRELVSEEPWTLTLEESTPFRAVVKTEGLVGLSGKPPLAKLSIRYQFFAGESFVRLYHTFTWMEKSMDPGAGSIALRLKPRMETARKVTFGLSDYRSDAARVSEKESNQKIVAYQDRWDHFAITDGENILHNGRHLGGWFSIEDSNGRGVAVSVKNLWQTYPKVLAYEDGVMRIGLWPEEAGRFSFEERDIMPDEYYYATHWKSYPWTRHGGPTWFNTQDIRPERAGHFLRALKKQTNRDIPSPGLRIYQGLSPELKERIQSWNPLDSISDAFRARIAHGMNGFLEQGDFYDAEAWNGVGLRSRARELLKKGIPNLTEEERIWLNRLLIESAFPEDLARSDIPHFIHEQGPFGKWKQGNYLHTGEGAARTYEVAVFFFDPSSRRSAWELNSLIQHPLVMRQSPQYAMQVPVLGFDLSPVDTVKYPNVERALDQYGRAVVARWPEAHNFGFLRFGMQRMQGPGEGLYRWFAGMQYDQQVIPWLLFMRGGDRDFYEEGMNTARYAMDVHTNHYNSRGVPTGYMTFVSGMPLPWQNVHHAFNMKIHFLSLYYHLTGYRRAREVMEEAIEGTRQAYLQQQPRPSVRELYSMNMFFAHAYEETFDPEIEKLARQSLGRTLDEHYDPKLSTFATNDAYIFEGLVPLHRIFKGPKLREAMLEFLAGSGAPEPINGGLPRGAAKTIACGWAYDQTKDERYARVIWDLTRVLADITPDHNWSCEEPVDYPFGNFQAYSHRVLPMLVGLGVMRDRADFDFPAASSIHDLFVSINQPGSTGTVYVKAREDGDLVLHLEGVPARTGGEGDTLLVSLFRVSDGEKVAVAQVKAVSIVGDHRGALRPGRKTTTTLRNVLRIPSARKGEVYRLFCKGGGALTGLLVLSEDASVVHEIAPDFVRLYGHSFQYYVGTRAFIRLKEDALRITRRPGNAAFTIRDGETHEVLARSNLLDPLSTVYRLGKGRMVEIVMGAGRDTAWKLEGIEPYISATRDDWFAPDSQVEAR